MYLEEEKDVIEAEEVKETETKAEEKRMIQITVRKNTISLKKTLIKP